LGDLCARARRCAATRGLRQRLQDDRRRSRCLSAGRSYFYEWHLKHALDRLLKKLCSDDDPDRRAEYELLRGRLDAAFTGVSFGRPFVADAHAVDSRRLSDWLATTGAVVEAKFARRGLSTSRSLDSPLSTSPMDACVTPICDAIRPRAYALKTASAPTGC